MFQFGAGGAAMCSVAAQDLSLDGRSADMESQAAVAAFRGSGPSGEQLAVITSASVVEYDVANERPLT